MQSRPRISFWKWFDRVIAGSLGHQLLLVLGVFAALVVGGAFLAHLDRGHMAEVNSQAVGPLWWSLLHLTDSGFLANGTTGGLLRVVSFLLTMAGVLVVGGWLLAVFVNGYEARLRRAREGQTRYRFHGGHGLVLGWGCMGPAAVRQLFRQGCAEVVILALHDAETIRAQCRDALAAPDLAGRSEAVTVLKGSFVSPQELDSLHLGAAEAVVILGDAEVRGPDGRNLHAALLIAELVARAGRREPLACHVHIADQRSYDLLQELDLPEQRREALVLHPFNFHADWARRIWSLTPCEDGAPEYRPLAYRTMSQETDLAVHLVILGFGPMGQALAAQAARVAHYANGRKTAITVISPDLASRRDEFLSHCPVQAVTHDLVFEFRDDRPESPATRQFLEELVQDARQLPSLAICLEDPDAALATTLALPRAVHQAGVPILVQQEQAYSATSLLDRLRGTYRTSNIFPFGMLDTCYGLDLRKDDLPKAIHDQYLETAKRNGKFEPENENHQLWSRLAERYKWSSRFQADGYLELLRSIGYTVRPANKDDPLFEFSINDVEWLVEREHDRWWAERLLAGWTYGTPKDDARLRHPNMVPFGELEDSTKEYDRNAIRNMPTLLRRTSNLTIVPETRTK